MEVEMETNMHQWMVELRRLFPWFMPSGSTSLRGQLPMPGESLAPMFCITVRQLPDGQGERVELLDETSGHLLFPLPTEPGVVADNTLDGLVEAIDSSCVPHALHRPLIALQTEAPFLTSFSTYPKGGSWQLQGNYCGLVMSVSVAYPPFGPADVHATGRQIRLELPNFNEPPVWTLKAGDVALCAPAVGCGSAFDILLARIRAHCSAFRDTDLTHFLATDDADHNNQCPYLLDGSQCSCHLRALMARTGHPVENVNDDDIEDDDDDDDHMEL